jgi:hypothetical protein
MNRLAVEIWQQILVEVMETKYPPIFATSCTPSTFLWFMELAIEQQRHHKQYIDYMEQRGRLRLVCRAWNELVPFAGDRWLRLEDWSPLFELDPTTTTHANGGVGPVERLITTIRDDNLVTPMLSWASHILKRPAGQSPLRAYDLELHVLPVPGYNPFDDFLVETTTRNLECASTSTNTNTNTTLRLLSIGIVHDLDISISLSQISRTFTGLRSLFLGSVKATPQQPLRLAHLEVLYVGCPSETLLKSMETWETPALRHVHLEGFCILLADVIDSFLGRYAHQIESLDLSRFSEYPEFIPAFPSGFWAQFTALRLLALAEDPLVWREWTGWTVMPPPTHPCRYLVCIVYSGRTYDCDTLLGLIKIILSRWTWHDGVKLITGNRLSGVYYIVKNFRDDLSVFTMERAVGVLPEL